MKKEYTIGLDIGTNSVGWAVLKEDNQLVRRNMKIHGNTTKKVQKKNFWGVRLFDSGKAAAQTRLNRTTRRRYTRRRQRLAELRNLFCEEMNQLDPQFFVRLRDSFLVPEDKIIKGSLIFSTLEEEVAYHKKFPTIYHLRKELADSKEKADLRLIYLALAHMIKYRGHFLIEGQLDTKNTSVTETFHSFLQAYNQLFEQQVGTNQLQEAKQAAKSLTEKASRTRKFEKTLTVFPEEKRTGCFAQFLKLIVGNSADFKKIFALEAEEKLQFSKEEYDSQLEELLLLIGDEYAEVFVAAKQVYSAVELAGILTETKQVTNAKLSAGMVQRYNEHDEDLAAFKTFIRAKLPNKYAEIFKDKRVAGYAGYIASGTKMTQETFYTYLKKLLENVAGAEPFLEKIEQENFLRKQRTFDNGVVPHQIHLAELQAIIQRQAPYYPFLQENQEKIAALLTFRIPYYVGPLARGNSRFAWLKRNSDEAIKPWNFTEFVDLEQSANSFIQRMLNDDPYLPGEKVLPKHSLLYEKFAIYNELTKVTYIDDRGNTQNFSSREKQQIFSQLFTENRKVSKKKLVSFLRNEWNLEVNELAGIETFFNASYGTYHDLIKAGIEPTVINAPENTEMLEDIIKILTVFEDKRMIRKQLSSYEQRLSMPVLKKLERRHYTGWGRLSAKLINGIRDEQTHKTILDYLINDDDVRKNPNRNFMQLINDDRLAFKTKISEAQKIDNTENLTDLVQELPGSPAIKKGILQSLKIVEELVDIMGYNPKTIVVEMARENQTTEQGKKKSRPRLRALSDAITKFGSQLLKEYPTDNNKLQNDRLYLYYLQNGKDMYTGEELDIDKLSTYDIDHIIPQSFLVDNSLDNRVLTKSEINRGNKLDNVPSLEIVRKQKAYWEALKRSGLLTQRKFDHLTKAERGGLTEDDKANFIHRQLVETRQITKHVAQILQQRFNDTSKKETADNHPTVRIVTLKSALTSQFRKQFKLYKVREINDYHHAHDAYLNGVVANTLLRVYPKLAPELVYGDYRKFNAFKENKATAKKQFYSNIMKFFKSETPVVDENGEILWDKSYLATVKKVLSYHQMMIVKKTEIQKGEFANGTVWPKDDQAKLIPRKHNLDPVKYGGFNNLNIAYSVVFSYEKGKKAKQTLGIIGINIMDREIFEKDSSYYLTEKGFQNPQVKFKLPKYTLYEMENGRRRLVASAREAQKGNQMVLPQQLVTQMYHAVHIAESSGDSRKYLEQHRHEFSEILACVKDFAEKYILAAKELTKICELYEKNKESEIQEVAQSFVQLMTFTAFGAPADIQFFGEKISRKRYSNLTELLKGTIINQSITGLYETRRKLDE